PASVVIPIGQGGVTFAVGVNDNTLDDGTRTIHATASAAGYGGGNATIDILDNDEPALRLTVPQLLLDEGDGVVTATLTRNTSTDVPLTVDLNADKFYKGNIPATVQFGVGQDSVQFEIEIVDDNQVEGTRDVRVVASA